MKELLEIKVLIAEMKILTESLKIEMEIVEKG